jgi:hypothetical protein
MENELYQPITVPKKNNNYPNNVLNERIALFVDNIFFIQIVSNTFVQLKNQSS